MKTYIKSARNIRFNEQQQAEIRSGIDEGLDVSWYADPQFGWQQMWQIRLGLESDVDVSLYADPKFNWYQMEQIREGLESGVDVSVYAYPKFNNDQMAQIRKGLESGIDVSWYANPKFDWYQMKLIRQGLEKYANDPLLDQVSADGILKAYLKNFPSLAYLGANKYQKAKLDWQAVKNAVSSRQPLDVPALEEEFDLGTLEGRAAYTLGIKYDENPDGSVTFFYSTGAEIATLSSNEFDGLVRKAIIHSSTRQSFAKAFVTQLKQALGL